MGEFFLDLAGVFCGAQLVDQDLDPRLVFVVAPAVAVVDTQGGLGIGYQLIQRNEIADQRGDHRGAAHAPARIELRAHFAVPLHDADADIVQPHRRAVFFGRDHRDLELARQVAEFRMEARPLAHQLGIGARVSHLVCGSAGKVI